MNTKTILPTKPRSGYFSAAFHVLKKELIDALRDRRTLVSVLLSSVMIGPVILIVLSVLFKQIEQSRDLRVVYVQGAEFAPELMNFMQRQSFDIKPAPSGFEESIDKGRFEAPVLVINEEFKRAGERGESREVKLYFSSSNRSSQVGSSAIYRLIREFNREQTQLEYAVRGFSQNMGHQVEVDEINLASSESQAAQFTTMLPIFIMMAILYGALNAALDTTAGERERGSLEPLLMNPMSRSALVTGKWAAVAVVGMLTAFFATLSFFPAQWLIQTETLKAMFYFGLREAVGFLAVLVPFAAAASAVFMAVAIRCKTFKEAHANNTLVILLISMMPLVTVFDPSGDRPWYLWVPGLGQQVVMNKVLKQEELTTPQMLIPALVCIIITLICLKYLARQLDKAAVR